MSTRKRPSATTTKYAQVTRDRGSENSSRRHPPPPPQRSRSWDSAQELNDDDNSAATGSREADVVDQDDADYEDPTGHPFQAPGPRARQPLKIVDWRGELCRLLSLDTNASDATVFEELQRAETMLEEAQRANLDDADPDELTPRAQIIYRIQCHDSRSRNNELYLEEPWISRSGPYQSHLRAGSAIHNFELFLERGKDISFIVYKKFECCRKGGRSPTTARYEDPTADIAGHFVGESISIVSEDLSYALRQLSAEALVGIRFPVFSIGEKYSIHYPYLWWFHRRQEISEAEAWLDPTSQQHIGVFREYLESRLGDEWKTVDSLLSQGRISLQYIEYIFIPETILVSKLNGDAPSQIEGLVANSWLKTYRNDPEHSINVAQSLAVLCTIGCTHWTFDGNFQRTTTTARMEVTILDEVFNITDLAVYPARFADDQVRNGLRDRGEMFWKCRRQRYVCPNDMVDEGLQHTADQRYMVDMSVYKQMHPPDSSVPPNRDDLGPRRTSQDQPPYGDDFLMCLPTTIPGFNMQKKEWVNLEVSNIKDVEWNREAFDLLVADKSTKELVRALVDNHCNTEKNTDLISGKGNGLFILLHGAPGTGKTLTAETVAEIAEKPLYRVTCGDIGTKAEDVEKYLETVLLLGKTWSCVVLLDEADVFLEERTLFDLQRNALVSVFLRVLEYYDGILILTSNRVGIFDEAFKSRIQLTLRYKNLEEPQRTTIWNNLISRLEKHQKTHQQAARAQNRNRSKEHNIDAEEIRYNIGKLAKAELNGRQIRNAVATARQLAMFRNEPMQYSHLKVVIDESEKFDAYLKEVTGLSADLIQRDKGVR